ncbi:MAG: hypothetical protein WD075_02780 [Rhodospirillales bacterium]
MNDGKKSFTSTRMKLAAIFAVIAAFFIVIRLLPTEWPLFPADDSEFLANRYLRDGKCEAGYAIYEMNAARKKSSVTYLTLGDMKYRGDCGGQDLPGAIEAYRKAAQMGNCSANFYLAEVAIKHPAAPGVEHAPPENNLFASAICSNPLTDAELTDFYLNGGNLGRNVDILENNYLSTLRRRHEFNDSPYDLKLRTVENIRDGIGYDANPYPYKRAWLLRPVK